MKTFEELYNEIIASDELKVAFTEAAQSKESFDAFMKEHDCPATLEEVKDFLNEKSLIQSLNDDTLSMVAAGHDDDDDNDSGYENPKEEHDDSGAFAAVSAFTLLGCVVWTTVKVVKG